jgi:general secretion pathway protein A
MNKKLLSLYGLKWNPFSSELPVEGLYVPARVESFCWRIEHSHLAEGGFALVTGEPGTGKSGVLRLLSERLQQVREVTVGELTHPQSNLADFYREMGDIFGVPLRPHNRWGGFKALRERWQAYLENTLLRPILLIDEAQEMKPAVLSELRLLASTHFDSRHILSVVLAGDGRLTHKLRGEELMPLGSRIRTRLVLEPVGRKELFQCLDHLLSEAGNRKLMTEELMNTICDHALGNYRVMTDMAAVLLAAGAEKELPQLDEKLYFELFATPQASRPTRTRSSKRR